jgi:gamma-glutamylcyclotransferase (GGCT)/AIG2-like uncharacterized protein YtfP
MKPVKIFVYGTLMPTQGNYDFFLRGFTNSEKRATVTGELWEHNGIPMVVHGDDKIEGYVVELKHSWQLYVIDRLEYGYNRVMRDVKLDAGGSDQAYVYMFAKHTAKSIGAEPTGRTRYAT